MRAAWVLAVLSCCIGCSSSESKAVDGSGSDGVDSSQQDQRGSPDFASGKLATLTDPCGPSGITGADILGRTEQTYSTTLGSPPTSGADYSASLSISVKYDGGAIFCEPAFDPPAGSAAPSRPESIQVEVLINFGTDDGLFREKFSTSIEGFPGADNVAFSQAMKIEELGGSFDPQLDGYQDVTVSFAGTFTGAETAGQVGKGGTEPGKVPSSFPGVYVWPGAAK